MSGAIMSAVAKLEYDRASVFARIRNEVSSHLALVEVTSESLAERNHGSWVWDCTRLPTQSHYVPVFLEIIEKLEVSGEISPATHVLVETTTGNAGTAVAYLARELGYEVVVFLPEDLPEARIADVKEFLPILGGELRFTEKGAYVKGMVDEFREYLRTHEDGVGGKAICAVNHSRRPESVEAIRAQIEILLDRLPEGQLIDVGVVALGNGTTATGLGRAVKDHNPDALIVGVEPVDSPWFFTKKYGAEQFRAEFGDEPGFHQHDLIGTGGWGVEFPNLDLDLLDEIRLVSRPEWSGMLGSLCSRGFDVGHTSAACQAVVERLSAEAQQGPRAFFSMFYDPLRKY